MWTCDSFIPNRRSLHRTQGSPHPNRMAEFKAATVDLTTATLEIEGVAMDLVPPPVRLRPTPTFRSREAAASASGLGGPSPSHFEGDRSDWPLFAIPSVHGIPRPRPDRGPDRSPDQGRRPRRAHRRPRAHGRRPGRAHWRDGADGELAPVEAG